jgi:hypothetical protein
LPPECQYGEKSVQTLLLEYQSTFTTVNWRTNKDIFFGAAAFFKVSSFVIFLFQFLASSLFCLIGEKKKLTFFLGPKFAFRFKSRRWRAECVVAASPVDRKIPVSFLKNMPQADPAAGNFCNGVASNFSNVFLFGKLVQVYAKYGVNKRNYFDLIQTYVFRVAFF